MFPLVTILCFNVPYGNIFRLLNKISKKKGRGQVRMPLRKKGEKGTVKKENLSKKYSSLSKQFSCLSKEYSSLSKIFS